MFQDEFKYQFQRIMCIWFEKGVLVHAFGMLIVPLKILDFIDIIDWEEFEFDNLVLT